MTFSIDSSGHGEPIMSEKGTFRLKGSFLLSKAKENGVDNRHQIALRSQVSHQSIYSIFDDDPLTRIDLRVLAKILIDGVGMTPYQLANVKFGDIFEYVEEKDNGAAE
jgi:hypothetical protein